MRTLSAFILLLFLQSSITSAMRIPRRYYAYCSYLTDKIYCYGGLNDNVQTIVDMYSLYIHNTTAVPTAALSDSWTVINPLTNFGAEGRSLAQAASSPDRTKLYLHGGMSTTGDALKHPFIMYDTVTNTWNALPGFQPFNVRNPEIRRGTVSYVPAIDKLVYYGGLMNVHENVSVTVDGTLIPPSEGVYWFGFHNVTTFDMSTKQWLQIDNAMAQDPRYFYYGIESFYDPNSKVNYYIGGSSILRSNVTTKQYLSSDRLMGLTFPSYTWASYPCVGNIPSNRDRFTITLLPDSQTALMYGGTDDEETTLPDFCYLLSLQTMQWRDCGLVVPAGISAPRRQHTAVLVGNHLFILFGIDVNNLLREDLLVLNVADANNITFVQSYAYQEAVTAPGEIISGEGSNGLGTGAIVGIAVGCVVLIGAIIGIIFFMRKKKAGRKTESVADIPDDWDQDYSHAHREDIHVPYLQKQNENSSYADTNVMSKHTTSTGSHTLIKPAEGLGFVTVKPHEASTVSSPKPHEMELVKPHESIISKPNEIKAPSWRSP